MAARRASVALLVRDLPAFFPSIRRGDECRPVRDVKSEQVARASSGSGLIFQAP